MKYFRKAAGAQAGSFSEKTGFLKLKFFISTIRDVYTQDC